MYTFYQYQEAAKRTMVMDADPDFHKMVAGLGLAGEAGELVFLAFKGTHADREEVKKEIGDTLWYMAFVSHLYGMEFSEIAPHKTFADYQRAQNDMGSPSLYTTHIEITLRLCGYTSLIADCIKKEVGHKHPAETNKIAGALGLVMEHLCHLAIIYNLDFSDIAKGNIAKLEKRYPNGFSHADSLNRKD